MKGLIAKPTLLAGSLFSDWKKHVHALATVIRYAFVYTRHNKMPAATGRRPLQTHRR